MPHLPESARLWLERAEIDYIGPFVKAWASFNSWYREASGTKRDIDGLKYVKEQPNPVRSAVKPLLRPAVTDGHGVLIVDDEPAQKFKLLVRDLHVCLDSFHIELTRDETVERISFRAVCLGRGLTLPQSYDDYGLRYRVEKISGRWKSSVKSVANVADVRAEIEQDVYNPTGLQGDPQFGGITPNQRANPLHLYTQCNPRPLTDLFAAS